MGEATTTHVPLTQVPLETQRQPKRIRVGPHRYGPRRRAGVQRLSSGVALWLAVSGCTGDTKPEAAAGGLADLIVAEDANAAAPPSSAAEPSATPKDRSQTEPSPGPVAAAPVAGADALAAALSGAAPGEETQIAPGVFMTMHRVQATDPIADPIRGPEDGDAPPRWHRARSTQGNFSVQLPLPFNDFRIRSSAAQGEAIDADIVGAKTDGQLAYTASCLQRRDGALPELAVRQTAESLASSNGGRVERREVGGETRYEVTIARQAHASIFASGDALCQIVIEVQGSDPLPPLGERRRILDSFTAESPPG